MASKERYLIFPGSNFALKQPTVDAEKKSKAGTNRARKRFPGYFSKELPHATWQEVISDWWAKMSPRERGEVLAISDPQVMQQIAFINNQLLCRGILLQNGMVGDGSFQLSRNQLKPRPLTQKKRRPLGKGAIFQSSSSESDKDYQLLESFDNYFENCKNSQDTIIQCMEHFITINIKEDALIETQYFPKIIEKASHRRFLRRKWIPRSEKEVWKAIQPDTIQTWGDLETALALLLQNNLLKGYEPEAQKKMDQKLRCLELQLELQQEKESHPEPKAKSAKKKKRRAKKREYLESQIVVEQSIEATKPDPFPASIPDEQAEERKAIQIIQSELSSARSQTSDDFSCDSTPQRPKKMPKKPKSQRTNKLMKKQERESTPKKVNLRKAVKKNYASLSPVSEAPKKFENPGLLKNFQKEFKEEAPKPIPAISISQLLNKAKPFVPSCCNSKRSPDNSSQSEIEPRMLHSQYVRQPPQNFKSFELSDSLVFEVRKRDWKMYPESIIPSTQDTDSLPYHSDFDHDYFYYYEEEFPLPGGEMQGIRVYRTKQTRSRESSVSSAGRYERADTENESDEQMRQIVRKQEEETIRKFREAGVKIERCSEAEQELIYNQRLQKQKFKRVVQLGEDSELLMTPVVKQFEEQEYARQMLGMFASMISPPYQPCLTYEGQSLLW